MKTTRSGRSVKRAKRMIEESEDETTPDKSKIEVKKPSRKVKDNLTESSFEKSMLQTKRPTRKAKEKLEQEKRSIEDTSEKNTVTRKPIYMRETTEEKANEFDLTKFARDPYEELDYIALQAEDDSAGKKKKGAKKRKPRKKKAEGILTFGSGKKERVTSALKVMNNLKTPSQMTKINSVPCQEIRPMATKQTDTEIPHISIDEVYEPPFEPPPPIEDDIGADKPEDCQSFDNGVSLNTLNIPKKMLKTPLVPKKATKLVQERKASTPKAENKMPTKQELIKKCFGFDDSSTEDEEQTRNDSINFSPMQNVRSSFIQMTPAQNATRVRNLSGASTLSKASSVTGPMRFNFKPPPKPQVNRSKYTNKSLKPFSQAVKCNDQNEVSLFVDPVDKICDENEEASNFDDKFPNMDDNKEPLKTVTNTRNTVKATKQSLIYEKSNDGSKRLKSKRKAESGEENKCSPTKSLNQNVSRTYEKSALNCSIPAVESPKKVKRNKKDREFDKWANNQTHHFSEIEDFDLSFT